MAPWPRGIVSRRHLPAPCCGRLAATLHPPCPTPICGASRENAHASRAPLRNAGRRRRDRRIATGARLARSGTPRHRSARRAATRATPRGWRRQKTASVPRASERAAQPFRSGIATGRADRRVQMGAKRTEAGGGIREGDRSEGARLVLAVEGRRFGDVEAAGRGVVGIVRTRSRLRTVFVGRRQGPPGRSRRSGREESVRIAPFISPRPLASRSVWYQAKPKFVKAGLAVPSAWTDGSFSTSEEVELQVLA